MLVEPPALRLDAAGLQAIHRHLFQDVYPWAGELRGWGQFQGQKQSAAAGDQQTMNFASYQTLPAHLDALGGQLATELPHLPGLPPAQLAGRLAYYFDQYNYAHGFREGNGRTLAVAFALLGEAAGYRLDLLSRPVKEYNQARDYAILRPAGQPAEDLAPLRTYLAQSLRPLVGLAAPAVELAPAPLAAPPLLAQAEAMREVQQTQERIWRALLGRNPALSREIREGTRQVVLAGEQQPRRLAALREGAEQLLASASVPAAQSAASRLLRALPLLPALVLLAALWVAAAPPALVEKQTVRPAQPLEDAVKPTPSRRKPRL